MDNYAQNYTNIELKNNSFNNNNIQSIEILNKSFDQMNMEKKKEWRQDIKSNKANDFINTANEFTVSLFY